MLCQSRRPRLKSRRELVRVILDGQTRDSSENLPLLLLHA